MTLDQDRRRGVLAAKLGALVRAGWGDVGADPPPGSFPDGAVLHDPVGGRVWILLDEAGSADPSRRLGATMALARRAGASELHVVVDDEHAAPVVARRAAAFATPPTVWALEGTVLVPAVAAAPAHEQPPAPEAELYRPVLVDAGLEPVVEDGHLVGELRGLEVARVVVDADGTARVEAGVGRFDREIGAMMFADLGETDALARAVALVAGVRFAGAPRHPLNQLVPERWLRALVVANPSLVGASELRSVGSAVGRRNLKEVGIASAVGTDLDGHPLVVTCSTGVDLELVPGAADDRLAHAPDARLVLAVPERDALGVTTELARSLVAPAEVRSVPDGWQHAWAGDQ